MKKCFKCGAYKKISLFYKHPMMADGHLGKCKSCTKRDVAERFKTKRAEIAEYDKRRFQDPERKKKVLEYARRSRKRSPGKYKARAAVARAIKSGTLKRMPCEVCGNPKSQAHHDDYRKKLSVRWLCFKHHREVGHGQSVVSF